MEVNLNRIQELTRLNRGRKATPGFLASLSAVLGITIEPKALLPLQETDELTQLYRSGYQALATGGPGFRRFFSAEQDAAIESFLVCAANALMGEHVLLLTREGKDCGALGLDLSVVLKAFKAVIEFDGDSLQAVTPDGAEGILLDWNAGDHEQAYELAVWGSRLPVVFNNCEEQAEVRSVEGLS